MTTSNPRKKRIVVVCPGRGSYTSESLGYFKRETSSVAREWARNGGWAARFQEFLADLDERRVALGDPAISELDNKPKFSPSLHTRGEHASPLIYACAYRDFLAINREQYEIVALCGNSMGWYLALAFGEALDWTGAFHVIQTMGGMMREEIVGGQIIYPIVNEEWQVDPAREMIVHDVLERARAANAGEAYISIRLGGYVVLAGEKRALDFLLKNLPETVSRSQGRETIYPFQLINHAAFHTQLMFDTSQRAFEAISSQLFRPPKIPLVDGRGHIWMPYSTDAHALYEYTLGHQVYAMYDFTTSVAVALKEFMPDQLWLLGPGNSLGGVLGQILIQNKWWGVTNKEQFKSSGFVVSAPQS